MNWRPGPSPSPIPVEIQRLVDGACRRFDRLWRDGNRPTIESFLDGLPQAGRPAVLHELVALEVELRVEQGDRPTLEEYVGRFSDDARVIESAFASLVGTPKAHRTTEEDSARSFDPGGEPAADPTTSMTLTGAYLPRDAGCVGPDPAEVRPTRLGRYRVERLLGKGNFGRVYLARDDDLERDVAIKVPTAQSLALPGRLEALVAEGRLAAGLRHPGLVGVYDTGRDRDGSVFIVLEYVKGTTLSDLLKRGGIEPARLAEIVAKVADAVHHAHRAGLIHRDLKPSNIIIDEQGTARVTDFGLAVSEDSQPDRAGEVAGTPTHMAPEQVRGQVHRLDGRTDVWALGVIFYQGLTGRLPFSGRDRAALFDEILHREAKPPRQIDEETPRELGRICLKCLSKRMNERYETALDLAEDLRLWLASAGHPATAERVGPPRVLPKGLHAFDRDDAEFFLALLPGPRDRDGLPEAVRFWKTRIEDRDGDRGFSVGLLYGPSGAGKSSLVKAGLLPGLCEDVHPVYIEASTESTEARVLAALHREYRGLPRGAGLVEVLAAIRKGGVAASRVKTLLVLDQFEQWLQGHPNEPHAELVGALQQCDGRGLQALLLVRDDFWMAVTRFFQAIEVPLIEGRNSAPVQLFDHAHACTVLRELGRAFGRLPDEPAPPGPEADQFLDQAVAEMAGAEGRVTPIRLSLFAEVVRRRPWNPSTLRELGGVEGIGMIFLTETFDSRFAPPSHRLHRRAAQSVLQALLPAPSLALRGAARSSRELREAARYADRPGDFADLLRILDSELRMITPVDRDPDSQEADPSPAEPREMYYQLTHDFLVIPIRQWVERARRATRAGRAGLRLATIAASWTERPVPQRLPSASEWAGILWHTRPRTWAADERRMMRAATRHLVARTAGLLALSAAMSFGFKVVRDRERATSVLDQALKADYGSLPALLPEIAGRFERLRDRLEKLEHDPRARGRDRDVATLLLHADRPTLARTRALHARLGNAGPDEVAIIRDVLAGRPARAGIPELRRALHEESSGPGTRLRVACVLAGLEPVDLESWRPASAPLALALLEEDHRSIPRWLELLGPAAPCLVPMLGRVCGDAASDPGRRVTAAEALADLWSAWRDAAGLAGSVLGSRPDASLVFLRSLERQGDLAPAFTYLRGVLAETPGERAADDLFDGPAMAAITLAVLGDPGALRAALRHREDPRLRTRTIQAIAIRGLAPRVLDERFNRGGPDPAELQAFLLAWAESSRDSLPRAVADRVAATARDHYAGHLDPGVHSAAGLLLRRWGLADGLRAPEGSPGGYPLAGPRGWVAGPNGHTFVVLAGPLEFTMGSPRDDPDRFPYENRHRRRIDRSLAVATTEVTVEQYQAFQPAYRPDPRYVRTPGCPAGGIIWYEAVRYCNWLSGQAGLPREEWCYPEEVGRGMELAPDAFDRAGFRLPTEAEWEYFCRAGTQTYRPFGQSSALLDRYARTWLNSGGTSGPAGQFLPNEFGLFDTLGSLWEWCHDGPPANELYPTYPEGTEDHPAPDTFRGMPVNKDDWRIVRGGVFDGSPVLARSSHRDAMRASNVRYTAGFRVVRTQGRAGKNR